MSEDQKSGVVCDSCNKWIAVVHCNADDANLCLSCDLQVHAANTVSSKHNRSLLCNSCSSASSTILCHTHNLLLCQTCDFEEHKRALDHDRRPVEPFSGCPGAGEMLGVLGVGVDEKSLDLEGRGGCEGDWVWDTPMVMSLDDLLLVPTTADHGLRALGVPPLPKNRDASCGRQKDEILRQIRDLLKSQGCTGNQNWGNEENSIGFSHAQEENQRFQTDNWDLNFECVNQDFESGCQNGILHWRNDCSEVANSVMFPLDDMLGRSTADDQQVADGPDNHTKTSNIGETNEGHVVPGDDTSLPPKVAYELRMVDRDSAISRYKEKRKARRYDKHVRYESRRARAEGRVRIKGRFAKLNPDAKS